MTLHCLVGCSIGEVLGLVIGTAVGLSVWSTVGLAVGLAFLFGMGLAIWPVMARGTGLARAIRAVWLGEVVSIAVMEIAMNATDLALGGVQSGSLLSARFWIAMALAIPAGFIAAWPVNHWLISRHIKARH